MTGWPLHRFRLLVVLMTLETVYGLHNLGKDLIVRLFPGSHHLFEPGFVDFIHSVSWLQELIFFSGVVAAAAALALLFKRSIWVLAAYGANVFLTKADWLISGFNGITAFTIQGYISLVYQTVVMGLLIYLSWREELD